MKDFPLQKLLQKNRNILTSLNRATKKIVQLHVIIKVLQGFQIIINTVTFPKLIQKNAKRVVYTLLKNKPLKKSKSSKSSSAISFLRLRLSLLLIFLFFILNASLFVFIIYLVVSLSKVMITEHSFPPSKVYPYPAFSSTISPVSARSYIVYEKESRVVVASKNETLRFSPASTAKIMTAIVALEYYPLSKVLTATNIKSVEGSKMGLFENESMTVENLLYGLLLPSGNDAAYVLSSYYPGGVKGFVNAMNQKASELKLVNTHFQDPSGYEDANYTTAIDLTRLTVYALSNPTFARIVNTKSIAITDSNNVIPHVLNNINKLLDYNGVIGVKTGYTEEAGGVLVTAYISEGKEYIVVVMKSDDRFADSQVLLNDVIGKIRYITY